NKFIKTYDLETQEFNTISNFRAKNEARSSRHLIRPATDNIHSSGLGYYYHRSSNDGLTWQSVSTKSNYRVSSAGSSLFVLGNGKLYQPNVFTNNSKHSIISLNSGETFEEFIEPDVEDLFGDID